uniref:Uncharacterized protein n=1 Tax=Rousettus aegyptiacus TaxID=9407 RepID=A0A7J8FJE0_ROUAE|nr:hypothetical protein HJG63_012084 [Rousettus aegyptiacus]
MCKRCRQNIIAMPLGLKRETPRSPAQSLRPRVHPGHSALLIHGPDEWLKEPGPCTVAESQSTLVSAPADWTTEQLSHRMGLRRPVATLMLIMTSKTGMVTVRIISFIHYLRVKEIGYSSPHGIYDPFGGLTTHSSFGEPFFPAPAPLLHTVLMGLSTKVPHAPLPKEWGTGPKTNRADSLPPRNSNTRGE